MKKILRPLVLVLAFLLLTAGTYAAVSGDSLISLGYLKDTFFPSAVKAGEEASDRVLQKALDDALLQLEQAHKDVGQGGGGLYSETLQRRDWSDGQILTLSTGGTFVLLDGSAALVHTGAVVDVTSGTEAPSGSALTQNHRYLVGENTDAAVTVRSGAAALGLQGGYTLTPGKSRHTPFYDVSQSDWYYAQVGFAYERGLFSGVDEHHFSANTSMNRAMLMSVLHRLAGAPAAGDVSFTDVPGGQWYTQAVGWGASVGITSGTGNGAFSPGGAVTREQAVAMLYNYAYKYVGADVSGGAALSGYGDLDRLSNWARPAMTWAVDRGIISGAANGGRLTLDPQRGATRAEMAVMLKAFCEKIL